MSNERAIFSKQMVFSYNKEPVGCHGLLIHSQKDRAERLKKESVVVLGNGTIDDTAIFLLKKPFFS